MPKTHTKLSSRPGSTVPLDANPLEGRPLINLDRQFTPPKYGEDIWQCWGTDGNPNMTTFESTLNFERISNISHRLVLVDFAYKRLTTRGDKGQFVSVYWVKHEIRYLREFLEFLDKQPCALEAATQGTFDSFLIELREERRLAPRYIQHYIIALKTLWRLSPLPMGAMLAKEPWPGRGSSKVAGVPSRRENTTPRIPEDIMAPLLRCALFYIDVASKDILAADRELTRISLIRPDDRSELDRFSDFVDARRRSGRGLPLLNTFASSVCGRPPPVEGGSVNVYLTAKLANVANSHLTRRPKLRAALDAALASLGLEPGGMETPISTNPLSGLPWRTYFDPNSLTEEKWNLLIAAYVLTAYLSGMHDVEVEALERGCIEEEKDMNGHVYRYKIHGHVFKKIRLGGPRKTATWITVKPVSDAIRVMEELGNCKHIFAANFMHGRDSGTVKINNIALHLQIFVKRACELGFTVPNHGGIPWRVSPMQFRRTLAWHIAHRPFGVIAGMLQYKHASTLMFEGYAGSSKSGFRDEVIAEEAIARLDDIVDRYESFKRGKTSSGPAGKQIDAEFKVIRERCFDFPGMVADQARLRAMLKNVALTLYPAVLNDCYFEQSKALCLKQAKSGAAVAPLANACDPRHCANSCISQRHAAAWRQQRTDAEQLLSIKPISSLQEIAIKNRIAEIDIVLEDIDRAC